MVTRVRVRDIGAEEGTRLLHIVRRCSGSVVTWRRAQMVLLSAQGMDVGAIATVTFASDDRVRHGNQDRFESLQPRYAGGRPPKVHPVAAAGDEEDRAVSTDRPRSAVLDLEPAQARQLLRRRRVVEDIGHEGLRVLLREEGVSFQAVKTPKTSTDRGYEAKKNRALEQYAIADGWREPRPTMRLLLGAVRCRTAL